jgi:anti-sigma regulatory factor (Ser/Thr protein kinase)
MVEERAAASARPPAPPHGFETAGSDDGEIALALPAEVGSVSTARRLVQQRWPNLPDDVVDDVQLIVAELVSNAIKHGRPEIELRLRPEPFAIDVAVLDHSPALPDKKVAAPEHGATSGRGLLMVDQLAQAWGVDPLPDGSGKTVWASVSTRGQE